MNQRGLIELPAPRPVYPARLKAMWALHGRRDDCHCATCAHLLRLAYSRNYYKCRKSAMSHSAATDWRVGWPACGAWEPKVGGPAMETKGG